MIEAQSSATPSSVTPSAWERPFASTRYRFTPGLRHGEGAEIRSADNETLLTYRAFASAVSIVALLVDVIVLTTGLAATLFLIAERRPPAAAAAALLSLGFAVLIAMLVPRTRVTLYDGVRPVLSIVQRAVAIPVATYVVTNSEHVPIALLRRSILARLGRNRWHVTIPATHGRAWAIEESFSRAFVRKVLGKFSRRHEANVRIYDDLGPAGVIVRRPDQTGDSNYVDLPANGSLDRRIAVALATLIFGLEP